MKIKLSENHSLLLDDEDYSKISNYSLRLTNNKKGDPICVAFIKEKRYYKYVHQLILGSKKQSEIAYFADNNRLNCQKSNVKYVQRSLFSHWFSYSHKGKKKYRGVSEVYRAQIKYEKKFYFLGTFKNMIDAAAAYDKKALELYGTEFAQLNSSFQ